MQQFGTLKKLNIRDIWKNEATEFTVWLCDNLSALSTALEMELELEKKKTSITDETSMNLFDLSRRKPRFGYPHPNFQKQAQSKHNLTF